MWNFAWNSLLYWVSSWVEFQASSWRLNIPSSPLLSRRIGVVQPQRLEVVCGSPSGRCSNLYLSTEPGSFLGSFWPHLFWRHFGSLFSFLPFCLLSWRWRSCIPCQPPFPSSWRPYSSCSSPSPLLDLYWTPDLCWPSDASTAVLSVAIAAIVAVLQLFEVVDHILPQV